MKLKITISLALIILSAKDIFSTNLLLSEVHYKPLGNLKYEIQFLTGRDCRSIPLNASSCRIYNDSFLINLLPRKTNYEFLQGPTCTTYCQHNTSSSSGAEIIYYRDTIDFNTFPFNLFGSSKYPIVNFSVDRCCRNSAITTHGTGVHFNFSSLNLYQMRISNDNFETPKAYERFPINLIVGSTIHHSFAVKKTNETDSISYELDAPMSSKNTYDNYTTPYPFTVNCGNPKIKTCAVSFGGASSRGFYFDEKFGNIIFTPVDPTEVSTIVVKTKSFRKYNNQWVLIGTTRIDQLVWVTSGGEVPFLTPQPFYTIKAREEFCKDIFLKDIVLAGNPTRKDSMLMFMLEKPKYGKAWLLDSNGREKTLRYCWTPNDSHYLNGQIDNFILKGEQYGCDLRTFNVTFVKNFNFKVTAPDSLTTIHIRTFNDKNKNGIKDINENYESAPIVTLKNSVLNKYQTNSFGTYTIKDFKEKFTFQILEQNYIKTTTNKIILDAKFDSTYFVDLGFYEVSGIHGRVIFDNNSNCKLDTLEKGLGNILIIEKNSKTVATTNAAGYYFLPLNSGKYNLEIDIKNSPYNIVCSQNDSGYLYSDDVLKNGDFFLKIDNKNDLNIVLKNKILIKNNSQYESAIEIKNFSNKKLKNLKIELFTNHVLNQFSCLQNFTINKNLIELEIDSVFPFESKLIPIYFFVKKDSGFNNNQLCFELNLKLNDDNLENNFFSICSPVYENPLSTHVKESYSPKYINSINHKLIYNIIFSGNEMVNNFYNFIDELDTQLFDVSQFKIIDNPFGFQAQIQGNNLSGVLFSKSINIKDIVYFTFEIGLKNNLNESAVIKNSAKWALDYSKIYQTNETVNYYIPSIEINKITPETLCQEDEIKINFSTNFRTNPNTQFKFYLIEKSLSFAPILIQDSILGNNKSSKIKIFKNKVPEAEYYLYIETTNPKTKFLMEELLDMIQVNKKPKLEFITNIDNGNLCNNKALNMSANGDVYYQFYYNNQAFDTFKKVNSVSFFPPLSGVVQVITKTDKNCFTESPKINFTKVTAPFIRVEFNNTEYCHNDIINFKLKGAEVYNIHHNQIIESGYTDSIYTKKFNSGLHKIKFVGINQYNCQDADSIDLNVFPYAPKPIFTFYDNTFTSDQDSFNQWYFNGEKINGANSKTFLPSHEGNYQLGYKPPLHCLTLSDNYMYKFVSVNQLEFLNSIKIFPNPTQNNLNIENYSENDLEIQIFDITGKLLKTISLQSGENTIDVSELTTGLCFIKLINNKNFRNLSFIKE